MNKYNHCISKPVSLYHWPTTILIPSLILVKCRNVGILDDAVSISRNHVCHFIRFSYVWSLYSYFFSTIFMQSSMGNLKGTSWNGRTTKWRELGAQMIACTRDSHGYRTPTLDFIWVSNKLLLFLIDYTFWGLFVTVASLN